MFTTNIERAALENEAYRKVINTTKQMQLVLMTLEMRQEIGIERHKNATQFIRVESGTGVAKIYDEQQKNPQSVRLIPGSIVMIEDFTRKTGKKTTRKGKETEGMDF